MPERVVYATTRPCDVPVPSNLDQNLSLQLSLNATEIRGKLQCKISVRVGILPEARSICCQRSVNSTYNECGIDKTHPAAHHDQANADRFVMNMSNTS